MRIEHFLVMLPLCTLIVRKKTMATKTKLKTFSLSYLIPKVRVSVEIEAASFEDALEKSKEIKVPDPITPVDSQCFGDFEAAQLESIILIRGKL